MVLLLPSAWLACFLLFRELTLRRRVAGDWRFSFILASAAWGVLLAFSTEALSLATSLDAPAVRLWWLAANVALWGGLIVLRRRAGLEPAPWKFGGELEALRSWP